MQRDEESDNNNMATSRSPVLLLLDNLLSQDAAGIQSVLHTMRHELPAAVVNAYCLSSATQQQPSPDTVAQHLSVYLQTFPHQAAVESANDGSLPLHFAASLGDVTLSQIVWQAVRYETRRALRNKRLILDLSCGDRICRTCIPLLCVCGSQPCFLLSLILFLLTFSVVVFPRLVLLCLFCCVTKQTTVPNGCLDAQ